MRACARARESARRGGRPAAQDPGGRPPGLLHVPPSPPRCMTPRGNLPETVLMVLAAPFEHHRVHVDAPAGGRARRPPKAPVPRPGGCRDSRHTHTHTHTPSATTGPPESELRGLRLGSPGQRLRQRHDRGAVVVDRRPEGTAREVLRLGGLGRDTGGGGRLDPVPLRPPPSSPAVCPKLGGGGGQGQLRAVGKAVVGPVLAVTQRRAGGWQQRRAVGTGRTGTPKRGGHCPLCNDPFGQRPPGAPFRPGHSWRWWV